MEGAATLAVAAPSEILKDDTLQAFPDLRGNTVYPPHYSSSQVWDQSGRAAVLRVPRQGTPKATQQAG